MVGIVVQLSERDVSVALGQILVVDRYRNPGFVRVILGALFYDRYKDSVAMVDAWQREDSVGHGESSGGIQCLGFLGIMESQQFLYRACSGFGD